MLPNAATFVFTTFLFTVVPGQSFLFVTARALSLGRRGGFLSVLGNALGNTLGVLAMITAVSVGVDAIIGQGMVPFTAIKLVGAAYLLYLGAQAIRHRNANAPGDTRAVPQVAAWRLVWDGFFVGLTNTKVLVLFTAVMPQFVRHEAGAIPVQFALLALIFFAISFLCDIVWALAAGTLRTWFARTPTHLAYMGVVGGVMMIGLGVFLALSGSEG